MYARVGRHSGNPFDNIREDEDAEQGHATPKPDPIRGRCSNTCLIVLGLFFLLIGVVTLFIFVYHASQRGSGSQPWTSGALYTIAVIGDWGRDGDFKQRETADAMGSVCKQLGCNRVISVGDNFYPDGISSPDAAQIGTSFRQIYTAPSLKIPWNPIPGNHDYRTYPAAEVAYSQHPANMAAGEDGRWQMSAQYYNVSFPLLSGRPLNLILLDTSPMISEYYATPSMNQSALLEQDVAKQMRFFRRQLCQGGAFNSSWNFVFTHHPVYSARYNATWSGLEDLQQQFLPIISACPPQLFVSGHSHMLQSIAYPNQKTTHLISGAGSRLHTDYNATFSGLEFAAAINGFVILQIGDTSTQALFYDYQGNILFSKVVNL